ncbi:MAG TPA: UvrD-helicase domain-containing protein [Verrucomicrobiae bacterium]|jgi:DNA helicase-2/ATP-dependent DNA helicase PcrA|nr:UvrD-helicase domain-containing protein [Verrucomicrobiae bacterium]
MAQEKLLEKLNPAQKEAVIWPASPLLILAGAGSGKTRILTHRIAHLIFEGVPSFNILGVTFTNKAAQEMKLRVQRLVNQDVWISTFHATCLRILRMEAPRIEIDRNFSIYDDSDQLTLIKECVKELNMNEKQIHPKGVRERISRAKDYLMTPYQYAEKSQDIYEESVAKVYRLYEEKLTKLRALDFGDLISKTVAVLDRCPDVLENWQNRFQHILIDEYQDTNHAQYRLVKLLAAKRRQITVVGDPDQSIYAWRGADIRNILNFEKDYPDAGIIKMEQNYRSTSVVLDAANELIKHNRDRKPKALWTEREGGEKITLFNAQDERDEAMFVVNQVLKNRDKGRTLGDQVVFYRVHAQSRIIEEILMRYNVPYRIVGGTRFYDRREIKDLIAYLKAIAFPHDDISLKRIVNVPARAIGKKAVELLEAWAKTHNASFDEALKHVREIEELTPKAKRAIADFSLFLQGLRDIQAQTKPGDLLEKILRDTRYVQELEAEKSAEAEDRIENIQEFFSVVRDFEEEKKEEATLLSFLESISLMTDLDKWDQGTNVLTLMTMHMAKGLEFPVVYIVGLEEGIFPHINSFMESGEDLEEERRICYVGITRAKDKLYLSYARQRRLYGSIQHNLPSRFLNEIPSSLYQAAGAPGRPPAEDDDEILYDDLIMDDPDGRDSENRILFD